MPASARETICCRCEDYDRFGEAIFDSLGDGRFTTKRDGVV